MKPTYKFVGRAYPEDYRENHLDEIVATAAELSPNRWSFRQSRSILAGGLRARALESSKGLPTEMWASGIRLALYIGFIANLLAMWSEVIHGTSGYTYEQPIWLRGAVFALPLLTILFTTRWPLVAATGISWLLLLLVTGPSNPFEGWRQWISVGIGIVPILALSIWLALRTQGRSIGRTWAIPVTTGLLASATFVNLGHGSGTYSILLGTTMIGLVGAGVLLLAFDPRAFIAAVVLWGKHSLFMGSVMAVWGFDNGSQIAIVSSISAAIIGAAWIANRSTKRLTRI